MTPTPPQQPDEADQYRDAVGQAVTELEKLGMIDRVDGKPDGPATLNAKGIEALTYLVTYLGAMTYDADVPAVRLAHHTSTVFATTLTAMFAAIGEGVDPAEAHRAYQHALSNVRHLKRIVDA
jgi:hypothetical protein